MTVDLIPLEGVGEPEDVDNEVLYLTSGEAACVTRVVLRVDGGLLAGNCVMTQELLVESRGQEV